MWTVLATGGDAGAVDEAVWKVVAPHRGHEGDEGHHAQGLGHPSVRQHMVRPWYNFLLDHRLPPVKLATRQKKTELMNSLGRLNVNVL